MICQYELKEAILSGDNGSLIKEQDRQRLEASGLRLEEMADASMPEGRFLALVDTEQKKSLPLIVDFVAGSLEHRRRHGLSKGEPLARALGLKSLRSENAPFVLDATAGLGTDAFVMASMGCRVRAIERSPIVYALLADGYRRLAFEAKRRSEDEDQSELLEISRRLSFECGETRSVLESLAEEVRDEAKPDIIYLDPMYPEEGRSKSALPKKGMQIFRRLIGDDQDASELIPLALRAAKTRVVVKRPLQAPHLSGKPNHVFAGKTARYDMYLSKKS